MTIVLITLFLIVTGFIAFLMISGDVDKNEKQDVVIEGELK